MTLKTILVSDSIHGNVQTSYLEKNIISTQAFNRLHGVNQNSTVYLTFPSNRTKRFEHSFGSMHLAGEMFFYSIINSREEILKEFLDHASKEIKKLKESHNFASLLRMMVGDNDYSPEILREDPLYLLYCPKVIPTDYIFTFILLFQSVRCAALLHDLGHPPFSHITESALKEIWENVAKFDPSDRTERQKYFMATMKEYLIYEKPNGIPEFALHEKVGNCIADRLFENIINNTTNHIRKHFLCYVHKFVTYILNEENAFFKSIHNLISGSIDSDRLDYIVRDLTNSGFNHGKIEYDRLISSLKLVKHNGELLFCADIRALSTIEDFFIKRMKLYKYVIYHHRVVKTDNLLEKIVVRLATDYLAEQEPERETDNQVLPTNISGLWKAVKLVFSNEKYFNALIQWDDSWLLTVLRQQYYDIYINKEEAIKYQLEEFLSNKKHYISIIKRSADFNIIDKELVNKIDIDFTKLKNILGADWDRLIDPLRNAIDIRDSKSGFVLTSFLRFFEGLGLVNDFRKQIDVVSREVIEKYSEAKVDVDTFLVYRELKTGFEILPTIRNENTVLSTGEVLKMIPELHRDQNFFPLFFLYIGGDIRNKKELICKSIGQGIALFINDWAKEKIKGGKK